MSFGNMQHLAYLLVAILFFAFFFFLRSELVPPIITLSGGKREFNLAKIFRVVTVVFVVFTGWQFSYAIGSLLDLAGRDSVSYLSINRGTTLGTTCSAGVNTLQIPAIGLSAPVVEGESDDSLERGVWHLPQTPGPGEEGVAILTGHRWSEDKKPYGDVFFKLPELAVGDSFSICYEGKALTYRVIKTKVVAAEETDIFNPSSSGSFVALYTCHPLWKSSQRFVAVAEAID
jgi:LPXTG-site transpeptidase (sortase) family protein